MVVCSVALKSSSPRRPSTAPTATVARSPSAKPTARPSVKPTKKPGTGVRFLREENPDLSRTVSAILTPSAAPGGLVGAKKSSKAPTPPPSRAPVIINPAGMQPCAHIHTYIDMHVHSQLLNHLSTIILTHKQHETCPCLHTKKHRSQPTNYCCIHTYIYIHTYIHT